MGNLEQWHKAEESLAETERLEREKKSLEREEELFADPEHIESVRAEESIGDVFSMDDAEKIFDEEQVPAAVDEEIDALKEGIVENLGEEPRAAQGLAGKRFPVDERGSYGDAWRMASFREDAFRAGMREYLTLEQKITKAKNAVAAELILISRLEKEQGIILSSRRERVGSVREKITKKEEEMRALSENNPEVFVGSHLKQLREYQRDLDTGRLVETPYVEEQKSKVLGAIRTGTPMFIHGHLGSGKSELAIAAAREYLSGRKDKDVLASVEDAYNDWLKFHPQANAREQEEARAMLAEEARGAIIVSGSKQTHQSEFYGHRTLNIKEFFTQERLAKLKRAEEEYERWEGENQDASQERKSLRRNGLLKAHMDEGGGTFSDFFLGPIYRAMKEGRPVIIDEVDAIPPDTLISLNHILTRQAGETIAVQQDSGEKIKIKRGFSVLMTGNFPSDADTDIYLARQQMDAAFLSRLEKLRHDYLPQSAETNFADASSKERAGSELFHTLLARTMDRYGNMSVPEDAIGKLWKLAVFAKKSQDIFSGKWADKETGEAGLTRETVGKEVLSLRQLVRIIEAWQADNMRYELDHYLFEKFADQAGQETERAALYKIAQEVGMFDEHKGWPLAQDIEAGAGVVTFNAVSPKNEAGAPEWLSPRDTVICAFGEAPERTEWPEAGEGKAENKEARFEALAELEDFKHALAGNIFELEGEVDEFCSLDTNDKD